MPERDADITVEAEGGTSFPLHETGNGAYASYITPGAAGEKYRLNIKTGNGKQYLSDFVEFKQAPAIDSLSWQQLNDGVYIYVNTHDNSGKTRYYKWDFVEVWQYHAPFESDYGVKNGSVFLRDRDSLIYTCWNTVPSSNIFIQSNAKLSGDVVYKKLLVFIPASTIKLETKYSILVKQSALTDVGFDYWNTLGKNTESLGSLFDPQPSQLQGNIHSVSNPSEPVLGFISATTTQQQRIFIGRDQLTDWAYPPGPFSICDTLHITDPAKFQAVLNGSYILIAPLGLMQPFWAANPDCADCRLKGGVTTKPSFWP